MAIVLRMLKGMALIECAVSVVIGCRYFVGGVVTRGAFLFTQAGEKASVLVRAVSRTQQGHGADRMVYVTF